MSINISDIKVRNEVSGRYGSDGVYNIAFVVINNNYDGITDAGVATAIADYVASVLPGATTVKTHYDTSSTPL